MHLSKTVSEPIPSNSADCRCYVRALIGSVVVWSARTRTLVQMGLSQRFVLLLHSTDRTKPICTNYVQLPRENHTESRSSNLSPLSAPRPLLKIDRILPATFEAITMAIQFQLPAQPYKSYESLKNHCSPSPYPAKTRGYSSPTLKYMLDKMVKVVKRYTFTSQSPHHPDHDVKPYQTDFSIDQGKTLETSWLPHAVEDGMVYVSLQFW